MKHKLPYPIDWGYPNDLPYTNFHELNLDWILKRLKELTHNLIGMNEDFNNKIEDLTEKLEAISGVVDPDKVQEIINDIETLKTEITNLKSEDVIINNTLTSLSTDLESVKQTLLMHKTLIDVNKNNIDHLYDSQAVQDSRLNGLDSSVGGISASVAQMKLDFDKTLNDALDRIAAEQALQDAEITKNTSGVAANKLAIDALSTGVTGDLTGLTNRIVAAENKNTQQDQQIGDLNDEVNNIAGDITDLQAKDSQLTSDINNIHNKDAGQDSAIHNVEVGLAGLTGRFNNMLYKPLSDYVHNMDGVTDNSVEFELALKNRSGRYYIPAGMTLTIGTLINLGHIDFELTMEYGSGGVKFTSNLSAINNNGITYIQNLSIIGDFGAEEMAATAGFIGTGFLYIIGSRVLLVSMPISSVYYTFIKNCYIMSVNCINIHTGVSYLFLSDNHWVVPDTDFDMLNRPSINTSVTGIIAVTNNYITAADRTDTVMLLNSRSMSFINNNIIFGFKHLMNCGSAVNFYDNIINGNTDCVLSIQGDAPYGYIHHNYSLNAAATPFVGVDNVNIISHDNFNIPDLHHTNGSSDVGAVKALNIPIAVKSNIQYNLYTSCAGDNHHATGYVRLDFTSGNFDNFADLNFTITAPTGYTTKSGAAAINGTAMVVYKDSTNNEHTFIAEFYENLSRTDAKYLYLSKYGAPSEFNSSGSSRWRLYLSINATFAKA